MHGKISVKINSWSLIKQSFAAFSLLFITLCPEGIAQTVNYPPADQVAREFRKLLERPAVDFRPSFQSFKTDTVLIEKGFIYSEEKERVPILIYKPVTPGLRSFPLVICLHGTGGNKDQDNIKQLLYRFSQMGIMGVAIDARYHGERISQSANSNNGEYVEAIIKAWKNTDSAHQEHPFFLDTVYDLWRLTDYLITRPDVQADRLGMMGISMGGIQTWMAASIDTRIKVAVPVIAAQSFRWSLENNRWQGRAKTIWKVHEQIAKESGDTMVTKENVKSVWDKLLPGIMGKFDCPSMIRLFAPRPLLLLNTELDLNCPLPGAKLVFQAAKNAYRSKRALDKLKIHVAPNEPHHFIPEHEAMTVNWFVKWL